MEENTSATAKRPRVKILVGYHKPFMLFKSDVLVPIHCGRDVAMEMSKDGQLEKIDLEWFKNNMIGDNTGDNISKENRRINEMSAIYWAWKNYDAFGDPDYVGFMQYGKHLIFHPYMEIAREPWLPGSCGYKYEVNSYLMNDNLSEKYIHALLEDYDCLCPKEIDVRKLNSHPVDCRARSVELSGEYGAKAFDLMCAIIRRDYPEYVQYLEEIEGGSVHHPTNIFVMKRELFNKYAEFVFGVLLEIVRNADFSKGTLQQQRAPAYCSEFLTSMYISSLDKIKTRKLFFAVLHTHHSSSSPRQSSHMFIRCPYGMGGELPPPSSRSSLPPSDRTPHPAGEMGKMCKSQVRCDVGIALQNQVDILGNAVLQQVRGGVENALKNQGDMMREVIIRQIRCDIDTISKDQIVKARDTLLLSEFRRKLRRIRIKIFFSFGSKKQRYLRRKLELKSKIKTIEQYIRTNIEK